MKLVSYKGADGPRVGRLDGEVVVPLRLPAASIAAVLASAGPDSFAGADVDGEAIALDTLTLLPAVFDAPRIFCIGVNYEEHRLETGRERASAPLVFLRTRESQTAHGATIHIPPVTDRIDYEGEIAAVIGRGGRAIAAADAMAHVWGFSAYNDVSIRDWQMHTGQWTPGKNFDGSGGFGPCVVTADALPADYRELRVSTRLNGETVQDAVAGDMIFSIPEQIAYISTFTALLPGDVIVTGTPGGVGAKRTPPLFMRTGDVVEVEVSGIGTLRNVIG